MQDVIPLYMAKCVEDLEKIAVPPNLLKATKARTLENGLKSLYVTLLTEVADQEKCFVLSLRYLSLYDKLYQIGDKKFLSSMYSSQVKMVTQKLVEVKSSLEQRYRDEEQKQQVVQRKSIKDVGTETDSEEEDNTLFKRDYISCKELYAAIESGVDLLLVDIRAYSEYEVSKIKFPNIINIPDSIIKPGLSANTVGLELVNEAKYLWDKRDEFDAIVFLDWSSSSSTITSTKLTIMKTAVVEWDCLRSYSQEPVILDGGFIDFVESYPALVTNVHTIIARKNEDIDELLELDTVIYPKSNISEMHLKEFTIERLEESFSNEESEELKVESLTDDLPIVADELKEEAADKPAALKGGKQETPEEGKETVEETRQRLLKEARINKTKLLNYARTLSVTDFVRGDPWQRPNHAVPPLVRREIKPAYFPPGFKGWCGLVNIRNTCYMNTVLQCLKCVPVMRNIFSFSSHYENLITREPPLIIHPFANVIRELWEGTESQKKLFVPQEFYLAVCSLEPIYRQGNHEDCMEFFLFLFNQLNQDCAYDIEAKRITIEREKAWYEHLQGRTSIWVDLFYHQFHVTRICEACGLKADTYEIDNTLMVSFPNNSSCEHLNQLIEYTMSKQKILDFKCTKCDHLGVYMSKNIVVEPEILVIVLKRYYQTSWQETKKSNRFINFDLTMKFGRCTYRLYSMAEHQGTMSAGHYYAHGYLDNKWVELNDAKVGKQSVDWSTVKKTVCAFFYCKINKAM
ncbi:ubiquitin carboxyl-terminal hydrolase 8-like [Cylas formicarius]|uniref:ubiquitin carboxyl-terminal hydrolase 8-like n=1 Tax=Cylas formicarius TaxID=197179 RepID=UPI002958D096|nr:ubiquitin carboxyl-terminal hydrolase 8-like [Cylas formicarius]XP_060537129.1 ubiquitin carboxyl-terminal hydrolase 8-like [Cylas formicarius]XP_060537130.1 ubiquitin carboxyl-terminal hydrolase 8-like [Cylas formicarius]